MKLFNKLRSVWGSFTWGIRNIIRWTPVIWRDADFDWDYLAAIMRQKLFWMAESMEKYGHHKGSERCAKQMRLCVALLDRIRNDEYFKNAGYYRGEWDLLPEHCKRQIAMHAQKMSEQDTRYLGLILGKYLLHWWN